MVMVPITLGGTERSLFLQPNKNILTVCSRTLAMKMEPLSIAIRMNLTGRLSRLLVNFSTRLLAVQHLQDYYKRLGEPLQSTWRGITKHLEKSCRCLSLFENRLFSFALPCFLLTKQWLVTLDFIISFRLHLTSFNRSRL